MSPRSVPLRIGRFGESRARFTASLATARSAPPAKHTAPTPGRTVMTVALIAVSAAAICSGSAAVLQAIAVRSLPAAVGMSAGFLGRLARSPRYLAALVLVALGFALSLVALRTLPLFVVQAGRASGLAVTALLSVLILGAGCGSRRRGGGRDGRWAGSAGVEFRRAGQYRSRHNGAVRAARRGTGAGRPGLGGAAGPRPVRGGVGPGRAGRSGVRGVGGRRPDVMRGRCARWSSIRLRGRPESAVCSACCSVPWPCSGRRSSR